MTFSRDHVRGLVAAAIASAVALSEDMLDFDDPDLVFGMPDETITTRVDVTPWLDRKRAAGEAHASQIHDMAMFLAMPPETFAMALGTEFYIRHDTPDGHRDTGIFVSGSARRA